MSDGCFITKYKQNGGVGGKNQMKCTERERKMCANVRNDNRMKSKWITKLKINKALRWM